MYTNSHLIHRKSFQKGVVFYSDPFSYRTFLRRQNDYKVRLYWHMKQYVDNGSWVMFDTLTYDDSHLPHISEFADFGTDFSCFRQRDVKMFLDRLHSRLDYLDLGSFTHFVCSEYGHDSLYIDSHGRTRRGTKRPHYHILLFFENPDIDRVWMARQIHECWQCGRTDNFGSFDGDRSRSYVLHNCFDSKSLPLDRLLRVTHYVSKYVLKDISFNKKIDKVVKLYCRKNYGSLNDFSSYKAFLHDCNVLKRHMNEFVCLSNGFGLYAVDSGQLDMEKIWSEGIVQIPDKDKILRGYNLPEYYYRKLFCKCVKGRWIFNDLGREFVVDHLRHQRDHLARVFSNVNSNLCDEDKARVLYLMDGRSFQDLADYVVYYRGRVVDPSTLSGIPSKFDVVRSFRVIDDDVDVVLNDALPDIKYSRVLEYRTFWVIPDDMALPTYSYLSIVDVLKRSKRLEDWKPWIIDSSWFEPHYDFDDVLEVFFDYMSRVEIQNQQTYDKKSFLCQQLSLFGLSTDM